MPPMATSVSVSALALPLLPISPPMPAQASPSTITMRRRLLPAACAYALQEGQSSRFSTTCPAASNSTSRSSPSTLLHRPRPRPPLVFMHRSFHATWCRAERLMPFFSSIGFPCFALSLRAQGESSVPSEAVAGTLEVIW